MHWKAPLRRGFFYSGKHLAKTTRTTREGTYAMTTINTAANGIFTSLKDSGTSSSTAQQAGNALLNTLTGSPSDQQTGKTSNEKAFLLDLSPEAQSFLNPSDSSSANGAMTQLYKNFILTSKQQKQIDDVIAKYKDEPFTKETYYKIEAELDDLGLSPEALAIKDKARSVNTTSMLLDALNGTGGDLSQSLLGGTDDEQSQTKKDNYVKVLLEKWSDISTTIDDEPSTES